MKANILITLSRRACIADFGHATTDANDPTNFAIELCWAQKLNHRPVAHQIVERLGSLSACKVDHRAIDKFDRSILLGSSYSQAKMSLVHTVKLPVLNVCLDDALINFKAVVSPWKYPTEWLRANADNVNYIIQDITALTNSAGVEWQTTFSVQDIIYPRLIVYVFAHLALCTNEKRLVDEFKQMLHQWTTWDIITMLQNHQTIKDSVRDLFHQGLSPFHSEGVFRKILAWDVIGLCAHLAVVVTDDYKFKDLTAQCGPGAESLLDLLQARLDFIIDPIYKPRHVKAMKKLSRATGLKLNCVHIELEPEPVAQGGFGDIYRGLVDDNFVDKRLAAKVLRIYRDSDLIKLLKEFSSEAILWQQLSHPNILPFYGIYHLPGAIPKIGLMSPWMENGNIVEYLRKHADPNCVHLVFDIAQGLEYLHGHDVVHGDLKGVNVLIKDSGRACLADFGFSVAKSSGTIVMSYSLSSRTGGGTMRWQAPELLDDGSEDAEDI